MFDDNAIIMTEDELGAFFNKIDSDGDGVVTEEELIPELAPLIKDPEEEAKEASDILQSDSIQTQISSVSHKIHVSGSVTNLRSNSRVGDTRTMRAEQPIEDAESTEMKARLTNNEQQAADAEQASQLFQRDDPACDELAATFEHIKQLIKSDMTWQQDPNLRSIEQNGLKEDLALRHADLVKCRKTAQGSLAEELSHIHQMQQQVKSDMKQQQQEGNGNNLLGNNIKKEILTSFIEFNDEIVSSPAQLERDREEDLDDDIRASPHFVRETNTQSDYNHLNVHIDTTSEGDVPLQKPNEEDEATDGAVLDLLRANV